MRIKSTARIKRLPPHKRLIKLVGRATFWVFLRVSGLLRPWSVRLMGNALGSVFYYLSRRYRGVAQKNLRAVYGGEKSERELQRMAKEVFRHFSRESLEFFRLLSLSREQIDKMVEMESREILEEVIKEGRGVIALTAHYGNWELLARKLVVSGYTVNVIARDSDDPGITGITTRIRETGGYRVFDKDQPIIGAFRCLRHNELLGILPDQNDSHGIYVDFFGRPAATAVGPAVLSLRSGAPIVPIFCARIGDDKYRARVYPRIDFTPTGDEEVDVAALTALVQKAIEREVRANPTQWLWVHDRWKRYAEARGNG